MQEFLVMVGELFLISCIQSILIVFVQDKKQTSMGRIINIACYLGSLYIVLQFTFQYLLKEMSQFFRIF